MRPISLTRIRKTEVRNEKVDDPKRRSVMHIVVFNGNSFHSTGGQEDDQEIPITHTSAASGEEMYLSYCAACHGTSGKGDGPAASELKTPPTNLTIICPKSQCGQFPNGYVAQAIATGPQEAKAHGSKDMPVWGPLFRSLNRGSSTPSADVQLRINNLSNYIESLQVK